LSKQLPDEYKSILPSIEEIEDELATRNSKWYVFSPKSQRGENW
jgi:hypothetical protein